MESKEELRKLIYDKIVQNKSKMISKSEPQQNLVIHFYIDNGDYYTYNNWHKLIDKYNDNYEELTNECLDYMLSKTSLDKLHWPKYT